MKTPVQWCFDLTDAYECLDALHRACRPGAILRNERGELRRQADKLHELVQTFERDGLAEEYESVYLMLFDALSYLNTALGTYFVNLHYLTKARDTLAGLHAIGGEE